MRAVLKHLGRAALPAMLLAVLAIPALAERELTAEESEALMALEVVLEAVNKVFYYIDRATADLPAAVERDPEAWARVEPDVPELDLHMARAIEASMLMAEYSTGDHSDADVGRLVSTVHGSATTFVETAFEIHKFIYKAGVYDNITTGLFDAALELEDANRVLALHI